MESSLTWSRAASCSLPNSAQQPRIAPKRAIEAQRPQTLGETVDITFGDRVLVRTTPETEAARVAGLSGQVYGMTTPSVTGVETIGTPEHDHAINVHFEDLDQTHWFAPHLLEFVDHGPGTEIRLDGVDKKWVRSAEGGWVEEPTDTPKRPWWRFW